MIGLRLWRQRRRIILAMIFAGLAGLGFGGTGWSASAGAALTAGALMAVTVISVPGLRWFLLKLSIVSALAGGFFAAAGSDPDLFGPLVLAALVPLVLRFRWLDRFRVPWTQRAMAQARIARSVDAVWRIVRPVPGGTFWDPTVEDIQLGSARDDLVLKRRMPNGSVADHKLQLLEVAPLRFLKVRDRSYPPANEGGPVTVTAFAFSGDHATCRLLLIEAEWKRPLWKTISLWLDDYLGDYADHMAALIERRPDPSLRGMFLRALDRR